MKPAETLAAALLLLLWPLLGGLLLLISGQVDTSPNQWLTWGVTPALTTAVNVAPAVLFLIWMRGGMNANAPAVVSAPGLHVFLAVCLVSLSLGAGGVMHALHSSTTIVPRWVLLCLPFAAGAMLWPALLFPLCWHRTCLGDARIPNLSDFAKWTGVLFLTAAAGAGSACLVPFLVSRSPLEQLALSMLYQAVYYLIKACGTALVPPRLELPLVLWTKLLFRTCTVAHVAWTGNYLLLAAVCHSSPFSTHKHSYGIPSIHNDQISTFPCAGGHGQLLALRRGCCADGSGASATIGASAP